MPIAFAALFVLVMLPHAVGQTMGMVMIKYYANSVSGIGYNTAPMGQEYLILTMQITNRNETEYDGGFYVNPNDFYVIINQVEYSNDPSTYSLQTPLPDATVLPGGSVTGQIAFLVPGTYGITPTFKPTYQFADTTPTIDWIQWNSAPEFSGVAPAVFLALAASLYLLKRQRSHAPGTPQI